MTLKRYCIIALVVIMAMMLPVWSQVALADESSPDVSPGWHTGWITETSTVNGSLVFNRTFEYYIPTGFTNSTPVPLLFSFHGLGSTGPQQEDLTHFAELAEQEKFIAVFPDSTALNASDPTLSACVAAHNWTLPALTGSNIMWNCGEIEGIAIAPLQDCAGVDDVGFVNDTLHWFETNYAINTSRIYATGMSNGAMFSYYLAFNLPGVFAGIGPVTGVMDLNLGGNATTPPATTVIAIRSPTDPIIPEYGGCGLICNNYGFSTPDTITYWCNVDNIIAPPVTTVWSDTNVDTSTVTRYVYGPGTNGTRVVLFWETGSIGLYGIGHTWPGGPQYAEAMIIGSVSKQIDGSAQIWKYLPPLKYCLTMHTTIGGSVSTPGRTTFSNVNSPEKTMFFNAGTSTAVNLLATPDNSGFEFVSWTGNVSTIANVNAANTTITINPNTDYEIKANFQLKSVTPPPSGGCFIATAAYGTPTAKQLDVLRAFRDDVLLKSAVGSRLVDFYYKASPPIANFISQHNFVRTLVRELLVDPIVRVLEATRAIW